MATTTDWKDRADGLIQAIKDVAPPNHPLASMPGSSRHAKLFENFVDALIAAKEEADGWWQAVIDTGQEIEDMYSVQWWDETDGIDDISAKGRNAVVASYFEGKWRISEGDEHQITNLDLEDSPPYEPRSVELPFGEIRIIAALSSNYNDSPVVTVTGVLSLGKDGSASFNPIKASI